MQAIAFNYAKLAQRTVYQEPATSAARHNGIQFAGLNNEKTRILCDEYPLVDVDFHHTPSEWRTQPSLLVQLLSNGGVNLVNSNTAAKEPEIGPWLMHVKFDTPKNAPEKQPDLLSKGTSLVISKKTLDDLKKQQGSLVVWFSHPRIEGSQSTPVVIAAQPGNDCYTVTATASSEKHTKTYMA